VLAVLALSRRKKNPSTISRSFSLASWAERRAGWGLATVCPRALRIARMPAGHARPSARATWGRPLG
jgi:hypothetical protein